MKTHGWLWIACLIGVCSLFGCKENPGGGQNIQEPSGVGICGDGAWNEGEECDDGNTVDGDGCSASCLAESGYECTGTTCTEKPGVETCGNGALDPGEVCDDGNTSSDDGCLSNCLAVESGWTCPEAGVACIKTDSSDPSDPGDDPIVDPNPEPTDVCGDGVITSNEVCDDKNTVGEDGCSATCQLEEGWECPVAGDPCVKLKIDYCANGTLEADKGETCDDGNKDDGDGCSQYCLLEDGYVCDGTVCTTVCGDGIIAGTEVCDDANTADNDGCKADCSALEDGFTCINAGDRTYCASPNCGDGIINSNETCDYGASSTDASGTSYGWSDVLQGPYCYMCNLTPYCGDGIVNGAVEKCDAGLKEDGTYLVDSMGKPMGGTGEYGTCNADCTLAERCGDGIVNGKEACDMGVDENGVSKNIGGYGGCKSDCSGIELFCGDGITSKEYGEACDSGLVVSGELLGGTGAYGDCKQDCSAHAGYCGDGIVQPEEACDLGTDENGVSKNVGGYNGCAADCMSRGAFCGDGVVNTDAGEVCDEAAVDASNNPIGGLGIYDTCKADCSGKAGYCGDGVKQPEEVCDDGKNDGSYNGCMPGCMAIGPKCGDGNVDAGEVCDEGIYGNKGLYNGCGTDCKVKGPYCGDGKVESSLEQCDKGAANTDSGAYGTCSTTCKRVGYCGDGIKNGTEKCDNGAANNGVYGGCKADCTLAEHCGDGVVNGIEQCDKGTANTDSGAYGTCSKSCKRVGYCGDGVKNGSEQCDNGAANNGVYGGCKADCTLAEHCGDGVVNGNEVCDNGTANTNTGYGKCNKSCTWNEICGDGIKNGSEQCDAGKMAGNRPIITDADGKPIGGYGNYGGCNANCTLAAYCGDGQKAANEACDDKNKVSGDGCSDKCAVEQGYECKTVGAACTRLPCGNGVHNTGEQCDDGNFAAGDGCYNCRAEAGIMCRYGTPACPDRYCKNVGKDCTKISDLYGDSILDKDFEQCDDGNKTSGDGCSSTGQIEPGYICPTVGKRCVAATCGDGIVAYGEDCDDGNVKSNDGCNNRCRKEERYLCKTPGTACQGPGICSDGIVQHGETCDDGNTTSGDGCSNTCQIEQGYVCKAAGGECLPTTCGDGKLNYVADSGTYNGYEECDLGSNNGKTNSGCTSACKISTNYHCSADGKTCAKGTHGDGIVDKGEECDDGNIIGGDGCNPKGKEETVYECYNNECKPLCGDGITLWMVCKMDAVGNCLCKDGSDPATSGCTIANGKAVPAEECDDGNLTSGDGCSSQCEIEDGFTCTAFGGTNPKTIDIPAVYRDFLEYNESKTTNTLPNGIVTSTDVTNMSNADSDINGEDICSSRTYKPVADKGHSDFGCTYSGSGCKGMVQQYLDADKKPVLNTWNSSHCMASHLTCGGTFHYWYRDTTTFNKRYDSTLRLTQDTKDADKYVFSSSDPKTAVTVNGTAMNTLPAYFQPLYKLSWDKYSSNQYGSFTTEISVYFQYKGGEKLEFTGDDDLWVFVNDTLFVDLGGMQSGNSASNTLATTPYSANGINTNRTHDERYEVYQGGIYEMKIFNAERCDSGSNFKLTLDGFLNTGKSTCVSVCGDGIVAGNEECDPGNVANDVAVMMGCPNTGANACKKDPYCGNGIIEAGEVCDYGAACETTPEPGCTYKPDEDGRGCDANCQNSTCGNGKLESWEDCDCKGSSCLPSGTLPAQCMTNCMEVQCGDGIKYGSEECDLGASNGADGANCTVHCTIPRCGDGIVQPHIGEVCDLGDGNNTGAYGKCSTDCSFRPAYCGDGIIQADKGEKCDNGAANQNGLYNGCTTSCQLGPYCGDGKIATGEACDKGTANNTGAYGSGNCNADCTKAPHCGDGIVNGSEVCDYGAMNNDTQYNGCTTACKLGPTCGDGKVNGSEQCDKGAANNTGAYGSGNCNADCTFAPRCGDGIVNGSEQCDFGALNSDSAYNGCTTACKFGPTCGDGKVDTGYEQCDNGTANADNLYGTGKCTTTCTKAPHCGDGVLNGTEVCDYGTLNSNTAYNGCTTACQLGARCGDGVKNGTEQCDNGAANADNQYGSDKCSTNCTVAAYCGDGIKQANEDCDNGANNNDTLYGGCSTACKRNAYCGDGIVNGTEACDNGKDANGNNLNVGGYGPNACNANCTLASYCGDGRVQAAEGEECDNGANNNATNAYNTCSTTCKRNSHCGDGIVDPTEECDNGVDPNTNLSLNVGGYGPTACTNQCKRAGSCGDGIRQAAYEYCDNGSENNDETYDGCTTTCQRGPHCGDGIINGPEPCDGGETCTKTCTSQIN